MYAIPPCHHAKAMQVSWDPHRTQRLAPRSLASAHQRTPVSGHLLTQAPLPAVQVLHLVPHMRLMEFQIALELSTCFDPSDAAACALRRSFALLYPLAGRHIFYPMKGQGPLH